MGITVGWRYFDTNDHYHPDVVEERKRLEDNRKKAQERREKKAKVKREKKAKKKAELLEERKKQQDEFQQKYNEQQEALQEQYSSSHFSGEYSNDTNDFLHSSYCDQAESRYGASSHSQRSSQGLNRGFGSSRSGQSVQTKAGPLGNKLPPGMNPVGMQNPDEEAKKKALGMDKGATHAEAPEPKQPSTSKLQRGGFGGGGGSGAASGGGSAKSGKSLNRGGGLGGSSSGGSGGSFGGGGTKLTRPF